jgi:short-subunit dehydrogenase
MIVLISAGNTGLGAALTAKYREQGYSVYAPSHRMMDVNNIDSVEFYVGYIIGEEGKIDILINSAGVGSYGSLEDHDDDEILAVYNTNIFGPMRTIRTVLPYMRKQRSGLIINIGSLAGIQATPFSSAYSSSKAALGSMSQALSAEVADFGIKVIHYDPGAFGPTNFKGPATRKWSKSPYQNWAVNFQGGLPAQPVDLVAEIIMGLEPI